MSSPYIASPPPRRGHPPVSNPRRSPPSSHSSHSFSSPRRDHPIYTINSINKTPSPYSKSPSQYSHSSSSSSSIPSTRPSTQKVGHDDDPLQQQYQSQPHPSPMNHVQQQMPTSESKGITSTNTPTWTTYSSSSPPSQMRRSNSYAKDLASNATNAPSTTPRAKISPPATTTNTTEIPNTSYSYTTQSTKEQVECLEQALKLQIEKRMKTELKCKLMTREVNNNNKKQQKNRINDMKMNKKNEKELNLSQEMMSNLHQQIKELIERIMTKKTLYNHSNSNINHADGTGGDNHQEQVKEFSELFNGFIFELDDSDSNNIDGGDSIMLEKNDVLWFLKNELQWRLDTIVNGFQKEEDVLKYFMDQLISILQEQKDSLMNMNQTNMGVDTDMKNSVMEGQEASDGGSTNNNNDDGDDSDEGWDIDIDNITLSQELKEKEMLVSKLEGEIVQLQEVIQNTKTKTMPTKYQSDNDDDINNNGDQDEKLKLLHQKSQKYDALLAKYNQLENKHQNSIVEMQNSAQDQDKESNTMRQCIHEKDNVIRQLKDALSSAQENENMLQQQLQQHLKEKEVKEESPQSPNLSQMLHKEIQINSLKEEIEERDTVIREMREEMNKVNDARKKESSNIADKVRVRYLEGIVRDLEEKLADARGCTKHAARYGSLGYFDIIDSKTGGKDTFNQRSK